jgi:Ca2+-transporting ATPase
MTGERTTAPDAGTLAVLVWAPGPEPRLDEATTAGTMAFATFVFFQAFNLLDVRSDTRSVFSRATIENRWTFVATAAVVALLVFVVEADVLHGIFTTTDLTSGQWLAGVAIGWTILWVGEALKLVLRLRGARPR